MIFKTFSDMAKVMGFHRKKEEKPEKIRKCRRCGAVMRRVDGTNIYVCTGKLANGSDCRNTTTTSNFV